MSALRRRLATATAAAVTIGVVLTGCATASETPAATPAPSGSAVDDTLVIAVPSTFNSLDQLDSGNLRADGSVLGSVYSSLTRLTADGELVGDLASDWTAVSPTEWQFTLRDDATFQDGTALDASVVVWNVERLRSHPDSPGATAQIVKGVTAVEAVDARTVRITTATPEIDLPRKLAGVYYLSPPWAESADTRLTSLASGPYEIESYEPQSQVVLTANPDYYGDAPTFTHVVLRVVTDPAARLAGLKSGEFDASFVIDPADLAQLESVQTLTTGAVPSNRVQVLRFNRLNPALADIRVREAINAAIDRKEITDTIYRGLTEPARTTVLAPVYEGYDTAGKPFAYDVDAAKQLLADAGYADGLELELVVPKSAYVGAESAAPVIVNQLARVGITVKLSVVDRQVWLDRSFTDEAPDLSWFGSADNSTVAADLLTFYGNTWTQTHGEVDPAYDAAIAAAKAAGDADAQHAALADAVAAGRDDAYVVFLWAQPQTYAVSTSLDWQIRADDYIWPAEIGRK